MSLSPSTRYSLFLALLLGVGLAPTMAQTGTDSGTESAVLTPASPPVPLIHGPKVFGVRPGSPFLYTIPATGDRPMTFSADGLPAGLKLDPATGQITGTLTAPGEIAVTFHAANAGGQASRPFKIVVGDEIGLTPALGWSSWNCWGNDVDQDKVLKAAQAMVKSGLSQHGWTYINIDDTWQGARGGDFNAIQPDPKFPDIKGLVDQIHALGLKAGIYSTPWVTSYDRHIGGSSENPDGAWDAATMTKGTRNRKELPYAIGKYHFDTQDARQWAAWGFDYLKYDWAPVEAPETAEMAAALKATGRDMIFSLSNNSTHSLLAQIADVSKLANSWRTFNDITDNWGRIREIASAESD